VRERERERERVSVYLRGFVVDLGVGIEVVVGRGRIEPARVFVIDEAFWHLYIYIYVQGPVSR
jgi:hypothetical protein